MGESVLIIGVGGLGCNLIRAAQLMHAHPIFSIDSSDKKAPLATLMGAHAFGYNWGELMDYAAAWKISGFDVVIDTTGDESQRTIRDGRTTETWGKRLTVSRSAYVQRRREVH
jgi:Zn-dependent alcohol dehydrogenase